MESGRRPQTTSDEINFTLRQAMRTRAFWLMMLFAFAGFIVQAGVSLHQVPHFIDQGVPASVAVWTASMFAISQVPASLTMVGAEPAIRDAVYHASSRFGGE